MSGRPIRYIVEFFGEEPPVSYNCILGAVNARSWAAWTARQYGGRVVVQYADGNTGLWLDYRGSAGSPQVAA